MAPSRVDAPSSAQGKKPVSYIAFPRFALIAQPRSGTHFFRSLLNQNSKVFCYGEVLYPWKHFYGFYNWLRVRQIENPDLFYPHHWRSQLNDYLHELADFMKVEQYKTHVGYDFKIPQLISFQDSCEVLREFGFGIIHLKRINTAAAVISLERASVTVSRNLPVHGEKTDVPPVILNTPSFKEVIWEFQAGDRLIEHRLGASGYVEIFYEDMLTEKGRKRTETVLSELFCMPVDLSGSTMLAKQSPLDAMTNVECDDEARDIILQYQARATERAAEVEAM